MTSGGQNPALDTANIRSYNEVVIVGVGGAAASEDQADETSTPSQPPSAIAALQSAVGGFRQRPKSGRAQEDLAEELIALRWVCDLIELEFSETAAIFAETDEYDQQASTSPYDWIRHRCKMGARDTSDRLSIGRQLSALAESARAVVEGTIGFAHLSVIARTRNAYAEYDMVDAFDEVEILELARERSASRLWHFGQQLRHGLDAENLAREQRHLAEARHLRVVSKDDGSVIVRGWLDPIGGAAVLTALDPLAERTGKSDDRDWERRMADALVELASHGLDAGLIPQRGGQRPHLQVTTSLETLMGIKGGLAAEMEFSTPVSSKTVQRLACDATITRIVLGPDSAVIDVGRAWRVVSGSMRRALNARDQYCRWPSGCDRPASWSAAHHIVHWALGGETSLDNTILLCHRHHVKVHEGGWQLARARDGRLVAVPEHAGRFHVPVRAREPDQVPAA